MASSPVRGARDDAEYSANTTRASPSRRVPPMESAGSPVGSSAQVLPLDPSAASSSSTAIAIRNRKIFVLLCSGMLSIPAMAAISKARKLGLGCWAVLYYMMTITGQCAIAFRVLSNIFAQGGFTARFCGYIVRRFGYEGRLLARAAEFVDLMSTFFRHASSTLKSASEIFSMINAFHPRNSSSSDSPHDSVPLDDEINRPSSQAIDHSGAQCRIVSSISEGRMVISQWKAENAQISVDVPSTLSPKTAEALKRCFEDEGADHLLCGPTINAILEKALTENGSRNVEGSSLPLPSPDVKTNQ